MGRIPPTLALWIIMIGEERKNKSDNNRKRWKLLNIFKMVKCERHNGMKRRYDTRHRHGHISEFSYWKRTKQKNIIVVCIYRNHRKAFVSVPVWRGNPYKKLLSFREKNAKNDDFVPSTLAINIFFSML